MNNNTQIETVEDAANRLRFVIGSGVSNVSSFVKGANWQKQQDEAKYKELLDSHNELLEVLKQVESNCSDAYSDEYMGLKMLILVDKTINKAKNIKK